MKVETINAYNRNVSKTDTVKVTTCGNIIETVEFERVNRKGSSILNLGDDMYISKSDIDYESGELPADKIKKFQRTENRAENYAGMRASMKAVRDLINCNVDDVSKVRWMTFTYAENMTDRERLMRDRQAFWQRTLRWHKKQNLPKPEYISIVEPQGRGAWHLHEVWVYPGKAPFLPNDTIAGLWQQGFVTVKKLDDVDNVGAYLTAYLCDVPLDEFIENNIYMDNIEIKEAEITLDDGTKSIKKYVKGARLHLYPSKMNFYRTSQGIKRPFVEWMHKENAKKKVSSAKLTYSKTIRLTDDSSDYSNDIHYEYYNTLRE